MEDAIIVPVLKFLLIAVMAGGGVIVFRELIAMARGQTPATPASAAEEQK